MLLLLSGEDFVNLLYFKKKKKGNHKSLSCKAFTRQQLHASCYTYEWSREWLLWNMNRDVEGEMLDEKMMSTGEEERERWRGRHLIVTEMGLDLLLIKGPDNGWVLFLGKL